MKLQGFSTYRFLLQSIVHWEFLYYADFDSFVGCRCGSYGCFGD
jgi:hypothetical protein